MLRLPTLPDVQPVTVAVDINDDGIACGGSRTHGHSHAIVWDINLGIRVLENMVPGIDLSSYANAINAHGDVAGDGGYYFESDYTNQAFLWRRSIGIVGLGDLPGGSFSSRAKGLNNLGHVVGYSWSNRYGEDIQEAFLWTPETGMIGLGDLDGGFSYSFGGAINAFGQIAGGGDSADVPGGIEAFLWSPEEGMIGLGVLPGHATSAATDVNDREQVVGMSLTSTYGPTAFIWDRQRGIRSLSSLLDPCVPVWQRSVGQASAINNRGEIVAGGGGSGLVLYPYLPGDLDGDRAVTLQDLATLLSNFGRSGDVGYIQGDIHRCDRDVDVEDLAALLENFGQVLD